MLGLSGRSGAWRKLRETYGLMALAGAPAGTLPLQNRWFMDKVDCKIVDGGTREYTDAVVTACDFSYRQNPSAAQAGATMAAGGAVASILAKGVVLTTSCVTVALRSPVATSFTVRARSVLGVVILRLLGRGESAIPGYLLEPEDLLAREGLPQPLVASLARLPRKYMLCGGERSVVIVNASLKSGGPWGNNMKDVGNMLELGLAFTKP